MGPPPHFPSYMSENSNREPGTVRIPTWRAFSSYEDLYIGEWLSAAYALLPEDLPVCRTELERFGFVWVDEDSPELAKWIRLYRGVADHRSRLGMSWTTDLDKARWFAQYRGEDAPGLVYESFVPPWRFLAHIGAEQRNEDEYVVRTDRQTSLRRIQ